MIQRAVVAVLLGGICMARAQPKKLALTYAMTHATEAVQKTDDMWEAVEGGATFAVKRDGAEIVFTVGGVTKASGELEGGKLKLRDADKGLYFEIKLSADKIKVALEPDGVPWELKAKGDKFKVVRDEEELGKVKFYPDTRKLKVKNAAEEEVAVARDAWGLTAAAGVFLMDGLDVEKRNAILLTLLLLGT